MENVTQSPGGWRMGSHVSAGGMDHRLHCAYAAVFPLCCASSFVFPSARHSGDAPGRSSMPLAGGNDDDEWSEAWAEYKRECAEEAAEAAAAGITDADVANQTAPNPEPQKPAPLSDGTTHAHACCRSRSASRCSCCRACDGSHTQVTLSLGSLSLFPHCAHAVPLSVLHSRVHRAFQPPSLKYVA